MKLLSLFLFTLLFISIHSIADVPVFHAQTLSEFSAEDARQGVAVDDKFFYAISNFRISKHTKTDGRALLQWDGVGDDGKGPLQHMDSGMVLSGKLYAAHSNYPYWPMTSSVEIWDAASLEHIGNHSFGIDMGSFTWLDRHQGYWWGGF
jgi:hypothetical protein